MIGLNWSAEYLVVGGYRAICRDGAHLVADARSEAA